MQLETSVSLLNQGETRQSHATCGKASPCICCGTAAWKPKFRILMECGQCGFIRADVDATPEQIKRLYQEDYFRGAEYGNYLEDQATHRTNFEWRFRMIKRLAPNLKSIFEIGCAYGFWLECCTKHHLVSAGVDVCEAAIEHARRELGQDARADDFLSMDFPPGKFEAFCMWDTIEHLSNPEDFVARAYELLPENGWLFLTTGDIGSRMARWRGPRWRLIHPPTHLQYFSLDTMDRFLARHGFQTVNQQTQSMYRNIGEVLGRVSTLGRGVTRWSAKTLTKVVPSALQQRGFWLDFGDIMFIAARKIAS
ncbi:MAG: class I SAM-dependent methyltransferase [Pirellula sp.]